VLSLAAVVLFKSRATEPTTFQVVEFATIRWQGRENTHVIRPNGKVEKLRALFERVPRPDGIDDRSYYMSIAINAVAKEGYELAGMTPDEFVMKRPVAK
jgi:hypothetical protein